MPIYEFICRDCQEVQQQFQWLLADRPTPLCCGHATEKIPSVATAHFYGPGAYATEYGSHWRNKWGSAFKRHHEGKQPRRVKPNTPEAAEAYKEWH